MSDWHVAKASTWQHTILARDRYRRPDGIRTRNPSKRAAAGPHLRPRGYEDRHKFYLHEINIPLINIWKTFVSDIYKKLCWASSCISYSAVFLNEPNFPRPPLISYAYCSLMAVTCWRCKLKYFSTWSFRKTWAVKDQPTIILICCQIALVSKKLMVMDGEARHLEAVGLVLAKQHIVDTNKRSHSFQVRVAFLPLLLLIETLIPL